MNVVFVTSIRLLADALTAGLRGRDGISTIEAVDTVPELRESLATAQPDLILIDVTQEMDLDEARKLSADYPDLAWLALGLETKRSNVLRHGSGGFAAYVARDVTIDDLCKAIADVVEKARMTPPDSSGQGSKGFASSMRCLLNPFRRKASRGARRKY